jgi:hypothetical protein
MTYLSTLLSDVLRGHRLTETKATLLLNSQAGKFYGSHLQQMKEGNVAQERF